MTYDVDPNAPNASITNELHGDDTLNWNISYVYQSEFTLDSLMKTLEIIDAFKKKYPNYEPIEKFETLIRNEICHMFGGSLNF